MKTSTNKNASNAANEKGNEIMNNTATKMLNNTKEKESFNEKYEKVAKRLFFKVAEKKPSMQDLVNRYYAEWREVNSTILLEMSQLNSYLVIMLDHNVEAVKSQLGEDSSDEDIQRFLSENWKKMVFFSFGEIADDPCELETWMIGPFSGWNVDDIIDGTVTVSFNTEQVTINTYQISWAGCGWILSHFFDADSSELLAEYRNTDDRNAPDYISEKLYRAWHGHYFIFGEGGVLTRYRTSWFNERICAGYGITPLNEDEVTKWVKTHRNAKGYSGTLGSFNE